jgi:hypothetical protein
VAENNGVRISVILVRGDQRSRHAIALNIIEAQNRAKHALKTIRDIDAVQLVARYGEENEYIVNTLRITRRRI